MRLVSRPADEADGRLKGLLGEVDRDVDARDLPGLDQLAAKRPSQALSLDG